jgi:hypothetical protein
VSAVPFRLQPCENPTEASLDALTFGDPSLYEKLLTLNRVEILAENPRVRAGTIWYKVDREYAFVQAVAIRSGMYPLVYKVLPEMMAAQLGFSFVGRYFNMSYGYATRSLVWDEKAIEENGARSFSSVYPGMIPIVKLTAIIGGSTRTPVLVRHDQDAAAAAADASYLSDPSLANKLADVARLEVVTGSEGTRAGTIWYFRNGNYCFVIASAFRPEAPAEVVRLAPLLAAQLFGFSFVGNYTAIPADLKDKALCWDRYTGTPIPELAPLSERTPGVQDFVVTFADSPPNNPNPDTDPWPPAVCDSPEAHRYSSGWNYDGCYWTYSESPEPSYYYSWSSSNEGLNGTWSYTGPTEPTCDNPDDHRWQSGWNWDGCHWSENPSPGSDYSWSSNSDGLGGSWNYNDPNPPSCDNPEDHRWQSGWNWDGCHWSESLSPGSDYSWSANGDGLGGSWNYNAPSCDNPEDHRWQSGWNWDGCHWSESTSPGSDYSWSANGDGLGGSWYYSPPYNPSNDPEAHRYQSGWNWDGSSWSENPYPSDGNTYTWYSNGDGLGGYWSI